MYGLENNLYDQILRLRDEFRLEGLKAEFEAEGSQFNDLVRLRRLTAQAGVKLHLKIGGVEAVRDIKDSLELGVDGLIAPMVESPFGLKKFLEAYRSVYRGQGQVRLSINIETRNAVQQLDEILDMGRGLIDNITLGRTDLSASYLDSSITPDCDMVFDLVTLVGNKTRGAGMDFTVGGSISAGTVLKFLENPARMANIRCLETRKVILPAAVMTGNERALTEALKFEELYILSKKEISDVMMGPEVSRLTKLSQRAKTGETAMTPVN